jgi:hypothetical protein
MVDTFALALEDMDPGGCEDSEEFEVAAEAPKDLYIRSVVAQRQSFWAKSQTS